MIAFILVAIVIYLLAVFAFVKNDESIALIKDKNKILMHFLSLSNEDRNLRFGYQIKDAVIEKFIESINLENNKFFGIEDKNGNVVALCHLAIGNETFPELGVSVLPSARGHSFGTKLIKYAIQFAKGEDVEYIFMQIIAENSKMINIALKNGATVKSDDGCEIEVLLPV